VLELGYAYLSSMRLPDVARPHLEALTAAVHESSSVAVLDGGEILYVARVATERIMTVAISVGTRFPAHATSMGRVLLAALPPEQRAEHLARTPPAPLTRFTVTDPARLGEVLEGVTEAGWALVDQELEEGLRSIAVPVHDRDGQVVAAMNVSSSPHRCTREAMVAELLPPLRATVREVEADLRRGRTG
jgi:IclR family pca regulon transcriptional regulator